MKIDFRLKRIVDAQPYPLIFATISGAHLYGFPSPDSDFDLRGAHVLPLDAVLGLELRDETVQSEMFVGPDGNRVEVSSSPGPNATSPHPNDSVAPAPSARSGPPPSADSFRCFPSNSSPPLRGGEGDGTGGHTLEMDIVSHDVKKFFGLLLKKNGYVLEQLFSPLVVQTSPEHEELKAICSGKLISATSPQPSPPLRGGEGGDGRRLTSAATGKAAAGVITKHHSHHYFAFAETQWNLFLKESPRRVKPLLYVYRVLLTGIHLMRTGVIEANLVTLNQEFKLSYIDDLVARKLAGPENLAVGHSAVGHQAIGHNAVGRQAVGLSDSEIAFHEAEYQRLRGVLQSAHDASQLPELPSEETRAALNDLLVRTRRKSLGVKELES